MTSGQELQHVYESEIHAPADAIWDALTRGDLTERYWYNTTVVSEWRVGAPVRFFRNGTLSVHGRVMEFDPPHVLAYTWAHAADEADPELASDPPSTVRWTIEPAESGCRVTLVHSGFASPTKTYRLVRRGWNYILSGLQTLLENDSELHADWSDDDEARADLLTDLPVRGRGLVYEIYIAGPPEPIWQALTEGALTSQYFPQLVHVDRWETGAPIEYREADGTAVIEGELLEVDRPFLLRYSFRNRWNTNAVTEPPSRVTWRITPLGEVCRVTLVHDDFSADSPTFDDVRRGWLEITCGLKRVVETLRRDQRTDVGVLNG
ncbi:MAG: SRPBCC domain-containing protein [Candidatus Eremiobacteraeota bacterium]|nr:SRPBCC domain-containing protein [Candidatus Eremiobacteraeota bacterium]